MSIDIKDISGKVIYTHPVNTLEGADLRGVNLQDAYLAGVNLQGACLERANLQGVNLRGVNLQGAYLAGANLQGAKGLSQYRIAPEGAIRGFKKVSNGIVILEIPRSARRCNAIGSRKCRAEVAIVIDAPDNAVSRHDKELAYRVGETVKPDAYDPDVRVECSHGIHFFLTREEAEEYQ